MISYKLFEYGKPLQRVESDLPEVGENEILLRVKAAGVCHSDLHIRHGAYDLGNGRQLSMADRGLPLPLTLGHEIAGTVVQTGAKVTNIELGRNYLVYPWQGCGTCAMCTAGHENLCPTANRSMGVYQQGGYSDHVLVTDARYLIDIGDMDPTEAAPYACSGVTTYSAMRKFDADIFRRETLVIYGGGGLGLMAVRIAKALDCPRIVVVDPDVRKRDAALDAGASTFISANGQSSAEDIRAAAGGRVYMILDCVGSSETVEQGLSLLAKGGKLVQVGLFGGHVDVPTPSMPLGVKGYQGSYVGSIDETKALIALVRDKQIPQIPTTTRKLEEANEALENLANGSAVGRQVLVP
ncbi:alcohol dehydrogenase [Pollutimonas harenae]|uniref:Alcohol dehydrogenase catalytic domain-containing protein n=1 Tax=Pollutimonas harenae TaxID=657015 RepID=A0A853H1Y6_9BURK|nr:alcohol dehydrogenase [Pollutimonas harenae]NYT84174.1 alcohol dehydrogenase catalytic domain-containing protein [Pollutimonas harenae]TEA73410.1 alcohol dehydrogenase [Pollutimonas harenae]